MLGSKAGDEANNYIGSLFEETSIGKAWNDTKKKESLTYQATNLTAQVAGAVATGGAKAPAVLRKIVPGVLQGSKAINRYRGTSEDLLTTALTGSSVKLTNFERGRLRPWFRAGTAAGSEIIEYIKDSFESQDKARGGIVYAQNGIEVPSTSYVPFKTPKLKASNDRRIQTERVQEEKQKAAMLDRLRKQLNTQLSPTGNRAMFELQQRLRASGYLEGKEQRKDAVITNEEYEQIRFALDMIDEYKRFQHSQIPVNNKANSEAEKTRRRNTPQLPPPLPHLTPQSKQYGGVVYAEDGTYLGTALKYLKEAALQTESFAYGAAKSVLPTVAGAGAATVTSLSGPAAIGVGLGAGVLTAKAQENYLNTFAPGLNQYMNDRMNARPWASLGGSAIGGGLTRAGGNVTKIPELLKGSIGQRAASGLTGGTLSVGMSALDGNVDSNDLMQAGRDAMVSSVIPGNLPRSTGSASLKSPIAPMVKPPVAPTGAGKARESRLMPPPPPPPRVSTARPAETLGPPSPSPEQLRYNEVMSRVEALAPPEAGHERVFRVGEIATNYKPPETVKLYGKDMPYAEYQKQRTHVLAGSGARDTNPPGAAGRWFGNRMQDMEYYIENNPLDTPIYYADVPKGELAGMNVRKTEYSNSSLNHEREFVLPDSALRRASRVLTIAEAGKLDQQSSTIQPPDQGSKDEAAVRAKLREISEEFHRRTGPRPTSAGQPTGAGRPTSAGRGDDQLHDSHPHREALRNTLGSVVNKTFSFAEKTLAGIKMGLGFSKTSAGPKPTTIDDKLYYYENKGHGFGPFSVYDLEKQFQFGSLSRFTKISSDPIAARNFPKDASIKWTPLKDFLDNHPLSDELLDRQDQFYPIPKGVYGSVPPPPPPRQTAQLSRSSVPPP